MDNKRNRQECSLDIPNPKVLTLGQQEGNESQDVSRLMSKAMTDFTFKTLMGCVLFLLMRSTRLHGHPKRVMQ